MPLASGPSSANPESASSNGRKWAVSRLTALVVEHGIADIRTSEANPPKSKSSGNNAQGATACRASKFYTPTGPAMGQKRRRVGGRCGTSVRARSTLPAGVAVPVPIRTSWPSSLAGHSPYRQHGGTAANFPRAATIMSYPMVPIA